MILGLASTALTVGCASTGTNVADRPVPASALVYLPTTASALAFDPPATIGRPQPSFSRDGRALEAFAGYEDQVTTYSYTHQRDEIRVQTDSGQLDRRAYTDRTSVTTR